jgi:hypothetical protein
MPLIRIVLLLMVVGGLALVAFSNLSPVIALVFLGMPTPALPLATWMGIAIASGALTSFVLQFLQFLLIGSSTLRSDEPLEVPRQNRSFARDEEEPVSFRQSYTPPPPEAPRTRATSDWEEANARNWDFEPRVGANSGSQTDPQPEQTVQSKSTERTNETTQQPKTDTPSGVYSYSYREQEKKQDGVGKADAIYDANYRVIRPPNQPVESEDDEDWGFEDDDDVNEQSNNTKARR